jgi:hypothetical protein
MDAKLNEWFYGAKVSKKPAKRPSRTPSKVKQSKSLPSKDKQSRSKSPSKDNRSRSPSPSKDKTRSKTSSPPKSAPKAKEKQKSSPKNAPIQKTNVTNVQYVVNNYNSSSHDEHSDASVDHESKNSKNEHESKNSKTEPERKNQKMQSEKKSGFIETIKNVHKAYKDDKCHAAIQELLKDPSKNTKSKTTNANKACMSTSNKDEHCDEFLEAEKLLEGTPGASGWFKDKTSMHAYMQDLPMTKYCRNRRKI